MRPELLLLAERSIVLRYLVLTRLVEPADANEVEHLRANITSDPCIRELDDTQSADGTWPSHDLAWALRRYGEAGLGEEHEPVARAAEHLFATQQDDGSWPLPRGGVDDGMAHSHYDMVPLQTALPLLGLSACGLSTDPRCERAYQWLLDQRLPDGAWPTGSSGGVHGYVAGYRSLPHSRWGCRSNTTAATLALSQHPQLRHSPEAAAGLDHLLGRETRDAALLGFETARLFGFERVRGFFTRFGRFDPSLLLRIAITVGAGSDDDRVADLAAWVAGCRNEHGFWVYESDHNATPYVTYSLLVILRELGEGRDDWHSEQPRTPFQPYRRTRKRW